MFRDFVPSPPPPSSSKPDAKLDPQPVPIPASNIPVTVPSIWINYPATLGISITQAVPSDFEGTYPPHTHTVDAQTVELHTNFVEGLADLVTEVNHLRRGHNAKPVTFVDVIGMILRCGIQNPDAFLDWYKS